MTKVISLSEAAYRALRKRKAEGESFSDVVMKITEGIQTGSILELAGTWKGGDSEEVVKMLMNDRQRGSHR
jgi:predicted CopG family antitoxin